MASVANPQVDITVLISPSGGEATRRWLHKVARAGLRAAVGPDQGRRVQMGLVIADDDTLRRLNREYRGADEVTDVLSFSWQHQGRWEGEGESPTERSPDGDEAFPVPPEGPLPLGEVIVSYPQAQRQAQAQGHATERELALLIVHGILHLAGYDHAEADEEAEMKAKEGESLSYLFDGE